MRIVIGYIVSTYINIYTYTIYIIALKSNPKNSLNFSIFFLKKNNNCQTITKTFFWIHLPILYENFINLILTGNYFEFYNYH